MTRLDALVREAERTHLDRNVFRILLDRMVDAGIDLDAEADAEAWF